MVERKPITLKNITDYTVQNLAERVAIDIMYGTKQMFPPGPPPTRKQKLRWWIEDKKQRCRDIWTILSGGDIHDDCRDY